jgi:hypothetical protein
MKKILALMTLFFAATLMANGLTTQDNVDYNVVIKYPSQFGVCARELCKIAKTNGNGRCQVFSQIGIISLNLTSRGVALVKATQCPGTMEVDLEVNALPRVGMGNN